MPTSCHLLHQQLADLRTKKAKFGEALDKYTNEPPERKPAWLALMTQLRTELEADLHLAQQGLEQLRREKWEKNFADQYQAMHDIWQEANLTTYEHTAQDHTTTKYEIPTLTTVAEILERNQEIVKTKLGQGFTKLLIVPIGVKREELGNLLGKKLVELSTQNKLLRTKQNPTDPDVPFSIDPEQPFIFWNTQNDADIRYFSPNPDLTKQWVTIDTLVTTHQGWQVCLVEDRPNLPATADIAATLTTGGRTPLWAGMPPNEQLTKMGQGEYESEQGHTFAQWVTLFLDHLKRTNQVIDDYDDGKGKASWLTGEKQTNGNVPNAGANAWNSQAYLRADSPSSTFGDVAARPSVVMKRA